MINSINKINQVNIYLRIAGFIIKVNFGKSRYINERELFFTTIRSHYQGFVFDGQFEKIDYYIRIISIDDFHILFKKNGSRFLLFYFEETKDQITTFYHISLKQFNLLIHKTLNILLHDNGFMLHASAVNINGLVHVFTGRSGAGKSTIMKLLSKKYQPLADDSVIIRRKKQKFFLYQTPFVEKENWLKKQKGQYKIKRICFLKKKDYLKIEKIKNKEYILGRIIKQFWADPKNIASQSKIFLEFIAGFNNFYSLSFPKDKKIIAAFQKFF